MGKNKILIIFAVVIILILIGLAVWTSFFTEKNTNNNRSGSVEVVTEKKEYSANNPLRLKIKNNSEEAVCFSSCYPYYFEKMNGKWAIYRYEDCLKENVVERCIGPDQVKAFELNVPPVEKGEHRLALPACLGCNVSEAFKESEWLYSNDFIVN